MGLEITAHEVCEIFVTQQLRDTGEILGEHVAQAQVVGIGVNFQALGRLLCAAGFDRLNQLGLEIVFARLARDRSPEPRLDLAQFGFSHRKSPTP